MKVWQLIITGICVHLVLFYSIFDIYFTSPLVHGMTPVKAPLAAPSRRLVLFVADGLRADKFFESGHSRTPFLREIIEKHGSWGVSHTRVPTESRPGHVALIAGFYEDVSAVAKGWKENPVEFDSVFNESRHTWSWGSPDILPMFSKGASGSHVTINCYPSNLEDFAGSDKTVLDTWVFDQVKAFFASAYANVTLEKALREDKLVFFLHLLGLDTHGHSNKPHSQAYLNNIRLVDEGIKDVVSLIEEFYYHDNQTSYIMTADHGMTDWGSHGAGHAHETLTPFVAWGAGVRGPVLSHSCGSFADSLCSEWHLQSVKRYDVEQADIAPLMAHLIGTSLPVNSVGTLPIDVLDATDGNKAQALLANAEQILAQFQVKMDQIKRRTISATFRPFHDLEESKKLQALKDIRHLITNGQFQEAINMTHALIHKALNGLRYYQTYDRFFLGLSIILGFLGWMSYILYLVVREHTAVGQAYSAAIISSVQTDCSAYVFTAIGVTVSLLLYIQSLPAMYYIYSLMPVALWYKAFAGWKLLYYATKSVATHDTFTGFGISILFCIAGLELSIQSFYNRELISFILLALSAWPLTAVLLHHNARASVSTSVGWSVTCLLVAVFPVLPVVGQETQYSLVISSGIIALVIGGVLCSRFSQVSTVFSRNVWILQLCLLAGSVLTVYITSSSIAYQLGLPLACQIFSWSALGFSCILPLLGPTTLRERLFSLSLSFLTTYLLLSITYEGYFFLSLLSFLYFWLKMEYETLGRSSHQKLSEVDFKLQGLIKDNISSATFSRHLEVSDLRRAFFFIFFILMAFFGTGNIASINSFDPASVYCFLTVFNPFLMGTLMMLKNMIPFLVVTCAFRGVHVLTRTPLRSLFLIVLIMSDFMGLHFFFLVRDYGSWLEIGTTISHYVIVMVMIIFLLLLTGASHTLTCHRLLWRPKSGKLY
ncbi:hypothetical protein BsWGS_15683 [Bradybaena similaris]